MDLRYEKLLLDLPTLTQGNALASKSSLWCGRTAAAMVYNYYRRVQGLEGFVVNDQSGSRRADLLYPDGTVAAPGYRLSEPMLRGLAEVHGEDPARGVTRLELFPVADRSGDVDDERALAILEPVFRALENFNPALIYTSISSSRRGARHILAISGYRVDARGTWLHLEDPATIPFDRHDIEDPDESRGRGPSKFRTLGASNLEVLDAGSPRDRRGAKYWLRITRLFEPNDNTVDQREDLFCDYWDKDNRVLRRCRVILPPESLSTEPAAAEVRIAGFRAPLDFAGDLTGVDGAAYEEPDALRLTRSTIDAAYEHTEAESSGGCYPLGASATWHGGVHLFPPGEDPIPVVAPLEGEVLAARLVPEGAETSLWGSRNFVLLRHVMTPRLAARAKALHIPLRYTITGEGAEFEGPEQVPPLRVGDQLEHVDPEDERTLDATAASVRVTALNQEISIHRGWNVGRLRGKPRTLDRDEAGEHSLFVLARGDRLELATPVDRHAGDAAAGRRPAVRLVAIGPGFHDPWSWAVKEEFFAGLRSKPRADRELDTTLRIDRARVYDLQKGDVLTRVDTDAPPRSVDGVDWYEVRIERLEPKRTLTTGYTLRCPVLTLRDAPSHAKQHRVLPLGRGDVVELVQRASARDDRKRGYDTVAVVAFKSDTPVRYTVKAKAGVPVYATAALAGSPLVIAERGAVLGVRGLSENPTGAREAVPILFELAQSDASQSADDGPMSRVGEGWIDPSAGLVEERGPKADAPWCAELVGRNFFVDEIQPKWGRPVRQSRSTAVGEVRGWIADTAAVEACDGVLREDAYAKYLATGTAGEAPLWFSRPRRDRGLVEFGTARAERFVDAVGSEGTLTYDAAQMQRATGLPQRVQEGLHGRTFYSLLMHLGARAPLAGVDAATLAPYAWLPRVPVRHKVVKGVVPVFEDEECTRFAFRLIEDDVASVTGPAAAGAHPVTPESLVSVPVVTSIEVQKCAVLWDSSGRPIGSLRPGDVVLPVEEEPRRRKRFKPWRVRVVSLSDVEVHRAYEVTKAGRNLFAEPWSKRKWPMRTGERYRVVAHAARGKFAWNWIEVVDGARAGRRYWVAGRSIEKFCTVTTGPRSLEEFESATGDIRWDPAKFTPQRADRAEVHAGKQGWIRPVAEQLETESGVDPDIAAELDAGGVVTFSKERVPLRAGDPLWVSGHNGLEGVPRGLDETERELVRRRPTLHFEWFCPEDLLRFHAEKGITRSLDDPGADYGVDSPAIFEQIRAAMGDDAPPMADLDARQVLDLYADSKFASAMRTTSCGFVSEWGMDLKAAIPRLPRIAEIRDAKTRNLAIARQRRHLEPQLWWDRVAGVAGFPADPHVFHFHPFGFAEAFGEGEPEA